MHACIHTASSGVSELCALAASNRPVGGGSGGVNNNYVTPDYFVTRSLVNSNELSKESKYRNITLLLSFAMVEVLKYKVVVLNTCTRPTHYNHNVLNTIPAHTPIICQINFDNNNIGTTIVKN
uniref:Uncharacterized protein n=1 Tax=Glossina austeni TaxID=7395 RepID=A0A1A9V3J1_GLOAU